ncbi:NAD(P) transhydrogenase subunit alpha [Alcaligenes nematophilus]|uniref:NAD(P) transhydrogenase subunit alpha n=1 Tax=Alcaligenes TaxID=507 RepID=UPI00075B3A6E|nr:MULTISPECIES: NAD(P) transhydrogenase subunit alpha [Alcaligenes]KVX04400.1 NADP transhydrogenase subunit alpha [Alcaligenes faecalis]UUO12047.1 NAD(P) transhydrogenase subunit alpha [Alcaligenes faecalis]HBJ69072.1 NAD(P) transhydrogenase subunit alpha [Alcaligenes faecalis]
MRLGVLSPRGTGEKRVAATPDTIKAYRKAGHDVIIEAGAGQGIASSDADYEAAGATIGDPYLATVLLVVGPADVDSARLRAEHVVVGMLDPYESQGLDRLASSGCQAFALELIPRTTRAQSMDVLSSQANIAGYAAVLKAATLYPRFFPMMMTAAGTVKAARVVVLGAGVAGLQAIATARRLGAVVEASDVRPAAREQIESLGGKFIDVPYETDEEREAAQGVGGYARPMPASWLQRQAAVVAARCAQADVIITTALIPGRPAPRLIAEEVVQSMRAGSVIVDLAAARGGNCALTEADQIVEKYGVTLVGETNFPARVAADASALYARNIQQFLGLMLKDQSDELHIPADDDIVNASRVVQGGKRLFPQQGA